MAVDEVPVNGFAGERKQVHGSDQLLRGTPGIVHLLLARTEVGGYCAHCQTLRAREVEEVRAAAAAEPPKRSAKAARPAVRK